MLMFNDLDSLVYYTVWLAVDSFPLANQVITEILKPYKSVCGLGNEKKL